MLENIFLNSNPKPTWRRTWPTYLSLLYPLKQLTDLLQIFTKFIQCLSFTRRTVTNHLQLKSKCRLTLPTYFNLIIFEPIDEIKILVGIVFRQYEKICQKYVRALFCFLLKRVFNKLNPPKTYNFKGRQTSMAFLFVFFEFSKTIVAPLSLWWEISPSNTFPNINELEDFFLK